MDFGGRINLSKKMLNRKNLISLLLGIDTDYTHLAQADTIVQTFPTQVSSEQGRGSPPR
jgi:hypothetical protein